MNNEYIIIDKTAIQKRIEELEKYNERFKHAKTRSPYGIPVNPTVAAWEATLSTLKQILSQSTPLIPEIEKAFDSSWFKAHGVRANKEKEKQDYISNLKLDI